MQFRAGILSSNESLFTGDRILKEELRKAKIGLTY